MKDWHKLIGKTKTKEERDLIYTDMFFDVTGIDLMEDIYTLEAYIEGCMKIMLLDVGATLLIEELEEVGIKTTIEKVAALSIEKKRYLITEMKNLKEAWETIMMFE